MFCPKCGTKQDDDNARFCHSCGADLLEYIESSPAVTEIEAQTNSSTSIKGKSGFVKIALIIQSLALAGYGFLACLLHSRMTQYDLYSISQVGKPLHTMYIVVVYLGIFLIIYSAIKTIKKKEATSKYEIITSAITLLIAMFNSSANKVYTATSGGSLSGFLGYGINVATNGYDVIDEFFYSNFTVARYAIVALLGLIIAVLVMTRKKKQE